MKLLTKEQQESYENAKISHIFKEKLRKAILKIKNIRDHCHYTGGYIGAANSICNLKYSVPKKVSMVFHNGSNYDYHITIKELADEFKKEFICLGEKTEKYVTFSVPIEKEVTRIDKNGEAINILLITSY